MTRQKQYFGSLYIGTPPAEFSFAFDTGTAWTWLNHISCGEKCYNARAFDPAQSHTFEDSLKTFYGEERNGAFGLETIGLSRDGVSVRRQPLVLFQSALREKHLMFDGVVVRVRQGLGFGKRSEGSKTLVEGLKDAGVISQAVFAFHLADQAYSHIPPSALSLGSWDLGRYSLEKEFTYLYVHDKSGYWDVQLLGMMLNVTAFKDFSITKARFDSGSSFLQLPTKAFQFYREEVCRVVACQQDQDWIQFICPDSEEMLLPDITFLLGGYLFTISPLHYIHKQGLLCSDSVRESSEAFYTLGQPFLLAYYTLFDMESFRIGLARSVNYPPLPSKSPRWLNRRRARKPSCQEAD